MKKLNSVELRDRQSVLLNRCKEIVEVCKTEIREMTDEEQQEFDANKEEIKELNTLYGPKICFRILQHRLNKVLVLVYKKSVMDKTLQIKRNRDFLLQLGYCCESVESMIGCLKERLNQNNDFPHEIGVFLGYDLSDIIEFQNGNKNCIL